MEDQQTLSFLQKRYGHIERRLRILQTGVVLGLGLLLVFVWTALHARPASADDSGQVLRLRGLIIEDAQGRPRILIGAPVPKVAGRKRQDDTNGLILVGENGADRVALGVPTPSPQVKGQVVKRISPGAGLVIDDPNGNERGGMGVLDSGRGVLCLDYPDPIAREAVCLAVVPEAGFAGVAVNAPSGDNGERAEMAVLKDGTSILKLADTNGEERTMLVVHDESPAQFLILDPKANTKLDVLSKINP
jgi:hypothetical protein